MKRTFARSISLSLVAATLTTLRVAPAYAADSTGQKGELGNYCAEGLATGHAVPTDCKIHWSDPTSKKVYCFSTESAKAEFAKDAAGNEKKAREYYETSVMKKTPAVAEVKPAGTATTAETTVAPATKDTAVAPVVGTKKVEPAKK